jgi:hypothetical protein
MSAPNHTLVIRAIGSDLPEHYAQTAPLSEHLIGLLAQLAVMQAIGLQSGTRQLGLQAGARQLRAARMRLKLSAVAYGALKTAGVWVQRRAIIGAAPIGWTWKRRLTDRMSFWIARVSRVRYARNIHS